MGGQSFLQCIAYIGEVEPVFWGIMKAVGELQQDTTALACLSEWEEAVGKFLYSPIPVFIAFMGNTLMGFEGKLKAFRNTGEHFFQYCRLGLTVIGKIQLYKAEVGAIIAKKFTGFQSRRVKVFPPVTIRETACSYITLSHTTRVYYEPLCA